MSDGKIIDFATRQAVEDKDLGTPSEDQPFQPCEQDLKVLEGLHEGVADGKLVRPLVIAWDPVAGENVVLLAISPETTTPDLYCMLGGLEMAKKGIESAFETEFLEDE